jgi:hypothetical protein
MRRGGILSIPEQIADKRRLGVAILAYETATQSDSILPETVHVLREAGHVRMTIEEQVRPA